MNIGYVQFAPALNDPDATLSHLEKLLAKCKGANLVVLPELCNSGYNFTSQKEAEQNAEPMLDSRFIDFITSKCRELGCHIVTGFNERDGDHIYNSAVLVGADGPIGHYRKMHLFMNEKKYFQPGNVGLPVFKIGDVTVGILICFDWIFPETWRVIALKGADIICHPSNLVLPDLAQRAVPVMALMNRVFIVMANRIGTEDNLTFTGRSQIVDPKGVVLSEGATEEDEVTIVSIDPATARDKKATPFNDVFDDRRPLDYVRICETG